MNHTLFLLLTAALPLTAADWPRFMGPNGNGITSEKVPHKAWSRREPKRLWQVRLYDRGYAGPAVADGKVFIIDHRPRKDLAVVRALRLSDGKSVWTYSFKERGRASYGYHRVTPLYDDGRLYTISRQGRVDCIHADSGKRIWYRTLKGRLARWKHAVSPVVDGKHLLLSPAGNKNLLVVDKTNGRTIYEGGSREIMGYATPVIAPINNRKQYILFNGKSLIGVRPSDGDVIWRHAWPTSYDVNAATPTIIAKNRIFITSGYRTGCTLVEINGAKTRGVWQNKAVQAHFSSALYYKGYIYANSDPNHLVCLRPSDGKTMWKKPGFQKGGLIITDGVIIALDGRRGFCIMAKATPKGYRELGRFRPLGGQSWTAPIVAQGRLLVRNRKKLAAYSLR